MKDLFDIGAAVFAIFSAVVLAGPALAAMAAGPLSAEPYEFPETGTVHENDAGAFSGQEI